MKKENLPRFLSHTKDEWLTIGGLFIVSFLGLYFSIAMSVKIAQGVTLFGDSSNMQGGVETAVSSSDYAVLILFWILSAIMVALLVYYFFFKHSDGKKPVRKEIIDGKTVIIKEKEDESTKTH